MPRIWADTIEGHRRQVTDAILDAAAELFAEQGPLGVDMSAIAVRAGIGRATLYKYFSDLEAILVAWRGRDVAEHLRRLEALSASTDLSLEALADLVYAQRRHHLRSKGAGLLGTLADTLAGAGTAFSDIVDEFLAVLTRLMARLIQQGEVRADLDPGILARWLMHAVHAPGDLDDKVVARLLADALAPQSVRRRRSP